MVRTKAWKRDTYGTNDLREHRHEGGESIGVAAGRDRDAVFIVVRLDGGEHKVRKHEQAVQSDTHVRLQLGSPP